MSVSPEVVRQIEAEINTLAPVLVLANTGTPAGNAATAAILDGLAARFGRDTVLAAIQQIKNR